MLSKFKGVQTRTQYDKCIRNCLKTHLRKDFIKKGNTKLNMYYFYTLNNKIIQKWRELVQFSKSYKILSEDCNTTAMSNRLVYTLCTFSFWTFSLVTMNRLIANVGQRSRSA